MGVTRVFLHEQDTNYTGNSGFVSLLGNKMKRLEAKFSSLGLIRDGEKCKAFHREVSIKTNRKSSSKRTRHRKLSRRRGRGLQGARRHLNGKYVEISGKKMWMN